MTDLPIGSTSAAVTRAPAWRLFPLAWHTLGLGLFVPAATFAILGDWSWHLGGATGGFLVAVMAGYVVSVQLAGRARALPGRDAEVMLLPVVGGVFLALSMMLLATRGYYSRPFLFVAFGFTVSWLFVGGRIERRKKRLRFGVLPFGHARAFQEVDAVDVEWIERGDRTLGDIDALVVDLHAPRAVDWSRYMAEAALQGVPVIHSVLAFEALTGRVSLTHLTPLHIGGYRPSPLILWFKRVVDVIVSLLLLPVALPIVAIAAAVIRLDSPGSPLFAQERVGAGGTPFTMYKLRTMRLYDGPPVMAEEDDPRITRIGKFLRKVRIDELPQLINVLKGDMSLIGPRLEQVSLTRDFESIIPLFGYRHLVRPGITGWAQVTQGYASGVSSTRDKLEHDFYYIKHLSLWLELLVLFKTVRTILTGFGAR